MKKLPPLLSLAKTVQGSDVTQTFAVARLCSDTPPNVVMFAKQDAERHAVQAAYKDLIWMQLPQLVTTTLHQDVELDTTKGELALCSPTAFAKLIKHKKLTLWQRLKRFFGFKVWPSLSPDNCFVKITTENGELNALKLGSLHAVMDPFVSKDEAFVFSAIPVIEVSGSLVSMTSPSATEHIFSAGARLRLDSSLRVTNYKMLEQLK